MSEFFRCTACGEVVKGSDPCACVFDVVGVIDSEGVLHTAARVPVLPAEALCPGCWGEPGECTCDSYGITNLVLCCSCGELFEPDPEQFDAWGQSGRSFDPTDWQCPLCDEQAQCLTGQELDPAAGLAHDQYFHAMNMSEQLGMDWDKACAIARGDL